MSLAIPRQRYRRTVYVKHGYPDLVQTSIQQEIMLDARNPVRGRRKPKTRWIPPTFYSRSIISGDVYTYRVNGRSYNYLDASWKELITYDELSGFSNGSGYCYKALPRFPSYLTDNAITKARLKLKEMSINLPQVFAERDQTAVLVGDTCLRLVRALKAVRKFDAKKISKELRGVSLKAAKRAIKKNLRLPANLWLELQYGWKPLLSDVHGAAEALRQNLEDVEFKPICTVKSSQKDSIDEFWRTSDVFGVTSWTAHRRKTEWKAFVRLDFVRTGIPAVHSLASIGLTNPLELAWELLPFSFVADWFLPVGDWLSSLDATVGWDFKGGSISKKATGRVKHYSDGWYSKAASQDAIFTSSGSGYQMDFSRNVYTSAPLAHRPHFSDKKSLLHMFNGISLLTANLRGFK